MNTQEPNLPQDNAFELAQTAEGVMVWFATATAEHPVVERYCNAMVDLLWPNVFGETIQELASPPWGDTYCGC
jgi:hypothetical protein